MKRSHLPGVVSACIFSLAVTTTADAELHSRLGGTAAYDDVLNITWLTNAALSGNNTWAARSRLPATGPRRRLPTWQPRRCDQPSDLILITEIALQ